MNIKKERQLLASFKCQRLPFLIYYMELLFKFSQIERRTACEAKFFMLDLAPYSAHAATIIAKIIPTTNIILSFLYLSICYPNLYPFLINFHECILRCLSKADYLPRLIFLLTFTTSAKRAATTASVIPNTIIIVTLSLL